MSKKVTEKECDWGLMRILSLHSRPKCEPVKWKVEIARNAPICAGRVMYLCDYHKRNVLLKFSKVERL